MLQASPLVTADELARNPAYESCELDEGRLVQVSPVNVDHGRAVVRIGALLLHHVESRQLGVVLTETGFTLASNPDTVRAPDVAFVRRARVAAIDTGRFVMGPPDVAIEVRSFRDTPRSIRRRTDQYLRHGTAVVVNVDLVARCVTVHRRLGMAVTLQERGDVLDLRDAVDGFQCTLDRILN